MKPHVTPSEPSWWLWLAAGLLLLAGSFASPAFTLSALGLGVVQGIVFLVRDQALSVRAQTRFVFAAMVGIILLPGMQWLSWLLVAGLSVRVLFSYCGMARMLTLLSRNRREELSRDFVCRTFLSASEVDDAQLNEAAKTNP